MLLDARNFVKERIEELKERANNLYKKPKLVIIKVGYDKASEKYVNNKVKRCKEVGIGSFIIQLGNYSSNEDVARIIDECNRDINITGILLQLPLPEHLDENYLTQLIEPKKDVDGFTELNMGKLMIGNKQNIACTPKGIMKLLDYYKIELEGKDVLIVNRSNIVGKPLALMMMERNATVTIAHSKTKNLKNKVKSADVVVLGVGIRDFVGAPHFKDGATIIDVSINFDENGKLCGDVCKKDYNRLLEKNCNITPVPNGIGQMTVMALIEQTIKIQERNQNLR